MFWADAMILLQNRSLLIPSPSVHSSHILLGAK